MRLSKLAQVPKAFPRPIKDKRVPLLGVHKQDMPLEAYFKGNAFVCSKPMRIFLSSLHQFPFPASKFRVLLAIWFGFLIAETQ